MAQRIIIVAAVVILLGFGTDIVRLFGLQVINGDKYAAKAESQQLLDTEVKAKRGTIYDCDKNVLAKSATVWDVAIDPKNITDKNRDTLVNGLCKIFDYDDEERAKLTEKTNQESRYALVEEKVENDVKDEISEFVSENSFGNIISLTQTTKRYYPYNSFASSVLGFTGSDEQGLAGIESYYNDELTGTNGRIITSKDANSNKLPEDYETSIEATDGNSLVLTINQTIQYYLEKDLSQTLTEYDCKGAYGIVMDCNTGAILAMSSMPDYDLNNPYKIAYKKTRSKIKSIKNKEEAQQKESEAIQNQWRNFTVSDVYVPGSVYKVFVASAALEENVINENFTYTCGGSIQVEDRKMNCHYHPGHGTENLTQGLMNSCNPYFITVGQKLGSHNYFKYFEAFGFTEKTGIDLPGEGSSIYLKESDFTTVGLASASFGQTNSLTPIQVCTAISAIANGGTVMKPYVVSEIIDSNGNTVSKTTPTKVRQAISSETSEKVCKMMQAVVDGGTGSNAYVAGYSVGGKTGTSTKLGESEEGEKDKYIVSFAGIAPADDPQIAVLIIVDEPNQDLGGGALCAPIAANVIEKAMTELNIEPRYTKEELAERSIKTPNVIGVKIDTAKNTITSNGLKYKIVGYGSKVVRQSPSASQTIPSGGTIVLYTEKSDKQMVEVPDFAGLSISEANSLAAQKNINIAISGNDLTSGSVVAYSQSDEKGSRVEAGSVITVKFKNNASVLD